MFYVFFSNQNEQWLIWSCLSIVNKNELRFLPTDVII